MAKLIADRALFVDAAGRLCEADNPRVAFQLASRKGKALSPATVERYQLALHNGKVCHVDEIKKRGRPTKKADDHKG